MAAAVAEVVHAVAVPDVESRPPTEGPTLKHCSQHLSAADQPESVGCDSNLSQDYFQN